MHVGWTLEALVVERDVRIEQFVSGFRVLAIGLPPV
jgi:hypothetical protein